MSPQREYDRAGILGVYSGRDGCACGCRGSYRYAAKWAQEAGERRGYPVTKDEINDRQINKIAKVFEAAPDEEIERYGNDQLAYECDGKLYMMFFAPVED